MVNPRDTAGNAEEEAEAFHSDINSVQLDSNINPLSDSVKTLSTSYGPRSLCAEVHKPDLSVILLSAAAFRRYISASKLVASLTLTRLDHCNYLPSSFGRYVLRGEREREVCSCYLAQAMLLPCPHQLSVPHKILFKWTPALFTSVALLHMYVRLHTFLYNFSILTILLLCSIFTFGIAKL